VDTTVENSPPDGDAIIQRIQESRGHVWPLHHLMAELDPGFLDLFDQSYRHTLGFDTVPGEGSLAVRYRELICACACVIAPAPEEVTIHHLQRAFEAGLTEREAIEGFHALLIPSGGIALSNGVRALLRMREEAAVK
jgi:alkylhydroperoxidase/carboxymuconolactone decarboxylase family protein YurZ